MTDEKSRHITRRGFVKGAAGVVAAVPVAAIFSSREAAASDLPHVAEDDAQAAALGYKHDASESDGAGKDQICSGCQLWTGGDAEWGPCAIFPGKAVNANGWCRSWVAKAG